MQRWRDFAVALIKELHPPWPTRPLTFTGPAAADLATRLAYPPVRFATAAGLAQPRRALRTRAWRP